MGIGKPDNDAWQICFLVVSAGWLAGWLAGLLGSKGLPLKLWWLSIIIIIIISRDKFCLTQSGAILNDKLKWT